MNKKILIVEDNPINMRLLCDILAQTEYSILKAETAEDAIPMAIREKPELILMDIQLPKMDGITAVKKLKEGGYLGSTKVIALTAYAMEGDRERFEADGFDSYIPKPFHINEILNTVNEALSNQTKG